MYDSRKLFLGLLLTLGSPMTALAQAPPGNQMSPSELQAIDQARNNARIAAFNDLNDVDRQKVQSTIDQFNRAQLSLDDAAKQIDAVLSPQETEAIIRERRNYEQAIQESRSNLGMDDGSGRPPGPPTGGFSGPGSSSRLEPGADAGRFLLMMASSYDALQRQEPPP